MHKAIIYDCEFLTAEGVMEQFWTGPGNPDPIVVQIGAVKVNLDTELSIEETKTLYTIPVDRHGKECRLDPYFTELTGVTETDIQKHGQSLESALTELDNFSEGSKFWAWGKDEMFFIGVSCFIAGLVSPISAKRFGNAKDLLQKAGMPVKDINQTNSGKLSRYYGLKEAELIKEHDGLSDALSITYAMQHLVKQQLFYPEWLAE